MKDIHYQIIQKSPIRSLSDVRLIYFGEMIGQQKAFCSGQQGILDRPMCDFLLTRTIPNFFKIMASTAGIVRVQNKIYLLNSQDLHKISEISGSPMVTLDFASLINWAYAVVPPANFIDSETFVVVGETRKTPRMHFKEPFMEFHPDNYTVFSSRTDAANYRIAL